MRELHLCSYLIAMSTTSDRTAIAVGANVRAELARANRSQMWLAERLGLSQTGVSKRLSGKTAFDVSELCIAASVLGVDVSGLFAGAELEAVS